MGTSSCSHGTQIGHGAPLLRQRPRDAVVIEFPEVRAQSFTALAMQQISVSVNYNFNTNLEFVLGK